MPPSRRLAAAHCIRSKRIEPEFADLVDRQEQMARIVEEGSKAELQEEAPRRVINGIHFHCPNADLFGNANGSTQGIHQEQRAQSESLFAPINGQSAN